MMYVFSTDSILLDLLEHKGVPMLNSILGFTYNDKGLLHNK